MIRDFPAALVGAMLLSMFVFAGAVRSASAQSPSSGANPAPAPAPSVKQPDKAADGGAATAQPPKKRHVITNDNLNAYRGRQDGDVAAGEKTVHAIPGTGLCDEACAEQARQLAGFGPDRDGEWQFALAAARRSLAADAAWPGAYVTLTRAVNQYCTFQQQLQTTAVPSGNDYNSRVERAKTQKYAEDMNRVLGQNVTNANAQIERMAQQAEESEPARAAMMRVLAQRVNDSCDP